MSESTWEVTLNSITPAQINGAISTIKTENIGDVEPIIRPPSIKGMLRFWWRILNPDHDPKKLLEEENKIFGSTDHKSKIRIICSSLHKPLKDAKIDTPTPHKPRGRQCFFNYSEQIVKFIFDSSLELDRIENIKNSFLLGLLLGGLGKRSRRGFGHFSYTVKNYSYPKSENSLLTEILKLLQSKHNTEFLKNNISYIKKELSIELVGNLSFYPIIKSINIANNKSDMHVLETIGNITSIAQKKSNINTNFASLNILSAYSFIEDNILMNTEIAIGNKEIPNDKKNAFYSPEKERESFIANLGKEFIKNETEITQVRTKNKRDNAPSASCAIKDQISNELDKLIF